MCRRAGAPLDIQARDREVVEPTGLVLVFLHHGHGHIVELLVKQIASHAFAAESGRSVEQRAVNHLSREIVVEQCEDGVEQGLLDRTALPQLLQVVQGQRARPRHRVGDDPHDRVQHNGKRTRLEQDHFRHLGGGPQSEQVEHPAQGRPCLGTVTQVLVRVDDQLEREPVADAAQQIDPAPLGRTRLVRGIRFHEQEEKMRIQQLRPVRRLVPMADRRQPELHS